MSIFWGRGSAAEAVEASRVKRGVTRTRRHKQGVSLLSIGMGSLPTLQLVECAATDFTSLDRRLAVSGQVLAGTDVIVDTKTNFGATVAHETEGPDPVGDQEARGVVGGCLAGGGTEADDGEKGTARSSASIVYLVEMRLTTLVIIFM